MATEYPVRDGQGQIVALQDTRPLTPEDSPEEQPPEEPRRSRAIAPGTHRPLSEQLPQRSNGTAPAAAPRSQLALVVGVAAILLILAIVLWPSPTRTDKVLATPTA